jgi:hypothetical protein
MHNVRKVGSWKTLASLLDEYIVNNDARKIKLTSPEADVRYNCLDASFGTGQHWHGSWSTGV